MTSESECEQWIIQLSKAIGNTKISDSYTKSELLGQGSFGKVYKGKTMATEEIVAIKYIDKKAMKSHEI